MGSRQTKEKVKVCNKKRGKKAAPPTIYPACEPKPPSPAPTEFNKAEEKLFLRQQKTFSGNKKTFSPAPSEFNKAEEKLFLQSCLWMRENKTLFLEIEKLNLISQHRKQIANSNFLCRSTNYSSFCLMCSPLELFHNGAGFF